MKLPVPGTRVRNTVRTLRFQNGEMTQQELADRVGLPEWKPYTLERREAMALDAKSELQSDPRKDARVFIENNSQA